MNNHLQVPFRASFVRCGFAAGAIVMSLGIVLLIDGLARHYSTDTIQLAQRPVVMAQR